MKKNIPRGIQKLGNAKEDGLILSQAKPSAKELNLKGLVMQLDLKSRAYPTRAEPIFESRAV